jgi:excisionase family DNA binding protein
MSTKRVDGTKAAALRYAADAVRDALYGLADSLDVKFAEFLTASQAAELLHLSTQTVYDMCKDGRLVSLKVGRRVLVSADAVKERTK